MASITVDVDVYLDEFDDQELIDELEDRGWTVSDSKHQGVIATELLTELEMEIVANAFKDCKPGTIGNEIYEKMRKR